MCGSERNVGGEKREFWRVFLVSVGEKRIDVSEIDFSGLGFLSAMLIFDCRVLFERILRIE